MGFVRGLGREIWEEEPRGRTAWWGNSLPTPTGCLPQLVRVPELAAWHAREEVGPPLRKLGGPSQLRSQRREGSKDACSSGVWTGAEGRRGKMPCGSGCDSGC